MTARLPSTDPVDRLIAWRKELGLSLAKAAAKLGVTPPAVQDWERRRKRPREENREVIQEVIGIDPRDWRTTREAERVARIVGQRPVVRARPVRGIASRTPAAKSA